MKYLLCCWLLLSSCLACAETLRIGAPQSEYDASHSYFKALIEMAYAKQQIPLDIQISNHMVQDRAMAEIKAGRRLDVYWVGTNIKRESEFAYVDIPLVKGLLGYRVFVLHSSKIAKLRQVKSLNELRRLMLCQGTHWPDTDIMKASKLRIVSNTIYENLFKQVYNGRCDVFPRGIHEGLTEVRARINIMPELRIYDELMLYYPFAMYFFVNKNNQQLADKLKRGLEIAIDDGSFESHMKQHPVTQHLFPLDKWIGNRMIKIPNPYLSEKTDINNSRYWITPP